jgi:ElaB/YqjD/DUF883 family membrane-anchored ribosome-binding protein
MSTQQRIEAESHKDPDTLEREIEQKRAEIDGIVHALGDKLSPGQMFDRVLGYARGNGGELLANLGNSIKGNPLAAVLASVGLAWLMTGKQPARARAAYSYSGGYEAWLRSRDGGRDDGMHLKERAGQLKDKAAHLRDDMADSLHDARERFDDMRDSVGERAQHASDAVRDTAHEARQTLEQMLREQPLAVAAIGIAAGALLGAILPATRQEDQWLGRSSDQLKDRGRALAEQGLERAERELDAPGEPARASSAGVEGRPPSTRHGGNGLGGGGAAPPSTRSH